MNVAAMNTDTGPTSTPADPAAATTLARPDHRPCDHGSAPPGIVPPQVPLLAVVVFVAVAAGLAWVACLPLWLGPGLSDAMLLQICAAAMMYAPAVATVVALIIQRRRMPKPRPSVPRYLGLWPLTPPRRVIWMIVLVFFGVLLLAAATLLLADAVGWADLDLRARGAVEMMQSSVPAYASMSGPMLIAISLVMIIPGALMTMIFAFGEEVGWRGWLLTSLRPLGTWPALLITGVIWGLWHAPLILLGYNFARPDLGGLALMVGGCVGLGILFGWSRIRSGSMWPAVAGHGMLNSATPTLILLTTPAGRTPDGAFVSLLGVPGWILLAACVVVLVLTGQFRRHRELGARSVGSAERH